MKKIIALLAAFIVAPAWAGQAYELEYGVAKTITFDLFNADGTLDVDEVDGGTEVSLICDQGTAATATNDFADEGSHYSLALTATELQCATLVVEVAATVIENVHVTTIGNASAQVDDDGGWLDSIPYNSGWDADIESEALDALNAYDPPTRTEVTSDINSLNDLDAAGVRSALGLATANLDTQIGDVPTVSEFNARSLTSDAYFDASSDPVANVTLVDTTTANTDMRGTDSAALATAVADVPTVAEFNARTLASASYFDPASDDVAVVTSMAGTISDFDALDTALDSAHGAGSWTTGGAGSGTPTLADDAMQSGSTSTTAVLASAETFADDVLNERTYICINGGTGIGQCRNITDNVSSTDTVTIDEAWTTTPDNTSNYFIGSGTVNVAMWSGDAASVQAGLEDSDDIWAATSRTLTSATNITSTGGTTVPQTGDSYARLGSPAGASVSADLAEIEGQTDDIGVAGAGLTAVPYNSGWDADIQSEVDDGLRAMYLHQLLETTYDPSSPPGAADAFLTDLTENDGGLTRFTTNSLENAPSGGGGGSSDWSTSEREEIRGRLGVTGTTASGGNTPTLALEATVAGLNDLSAAQVNAEVDTGFADYDPPTNAELSAQLALLNDLSAAEVNTEVDTAFTDYDPPTRAELTSDIAGLPTAAEIVAAMLAGQIEDQGVGYDLQCTLATILAYAAGDVSTSSGTSTYQDPGSNENRIVGTVSGSSRTSITITCP